MDGEASFSDLAALLRGQDNDDSRDSGLQFTAHSLKGLEEEVASSAGRAAMAVVEAAEQPEETSYSPAFFDHLRQLADSDNIEKDLRKIEAEHPAFILCLEKWLRNDPGSFLKDSTGLAKDDAGCALPIVLVEVRGKDKDLIWSFDLKLVLRGIFTT